MNGKRVWLYCRVASRENSVELLEAQKPILEDYAKEHGLEIVGCSSDVGIPTMKLSRTNCTVRSTFPFVWPR